MEQETVENQNKLSLLGRHVINNKQNILALVEVAFTSIAVILENVSLKLVNK